MQKQNSKPNRSIRFDEKDMKEAEKLGLDIPTIARAALRQEIARASKKCPTCGQALKKV